MKSLLIYRVPNTSGHWISHWSICRQVWKLMYVSPVSFYYCTDKIII